MASALSSAFRRGKTFLTPTSSSTNLGNGFTKAPEEVLFPKVDPSIDGEDCEHDCESCTIKYPAKFKVEESDKLYGHVNGWATHLLVATGKTDWVRDVTDEKGSVMEAVGKFGVELANGKLMLSASNIPVPNEHNSASDPTSVLLLPSFTIIESVTPADVPSLIKTHVSNATTSTSPLPSATTVRAAPSSTSTPPEPDQSASTPPTNPKLLTPSLATAAPFPFTSRPCPHKYLILLCSQKTRDARCGQSAPLLRRELERHLRPLGLYRDLHDERPGGVGIYFISHVGGHKYSANLMIYRRAGADVREEGKGKEGEMGEASQCIWIARVRPEDCEGIVKFTVLQGKVVKPERQLRGGFDRERGLVSW